MDRVSLSSTSAAGAAGTTGSTGSATSPPTVGGAAATAGRSASRARSLADDLRARSDDDLARLLTLRPDLTRPAPGDLTSLAARCVTRASLTRALDDLDTGRLQVLEVAAVLGDADGVAPVARLLGAPSERVAPLLDELWRRALLWRSGRVWHVPRPVAEALGPYVAGLASPSLGPIAEPDRGIEDLSAHERAILDRLTWGPPVGRLPDTGAAAAAGRGLLAAGWLVAGPGDEVLLPREHALRLRGGHVHRRLELSAPPWTGREAPAPLVDAAAGAQAVHVLGLVDELVAAWGEQPPRVLRAGGLAVRDLKTLAARIDAPLDLAAFVVETARDAGLIADDGGFDPTWTPTHDYDDWVRQPAADRWTALVRAWLASTRAPHRIGTRPPAPASGPVNALSEGASWPRLRSLRAEVLAELTDVPPGRAVTRDELAARLRWRHPLRPEAMTAEAVEATAQAAEWLGVTGRGALPEAVLALLATLRAVPAGAGTGPGTGPATDATDPATDVEAPAVAGGVAALLPAPVEHLVLQADLTAVVPGPVGTGLGRLLRLCADRESRGGASVYRFSAAGVRRGLDAGWSAQGLLDALAQASSTPVPQPLAYLVGDVARRHGTVRVGAVGAYLRCDDPAALDVLLARRELDGARLRKLAPTVAVSPLAPMALVETLRAAGGAPVLEGPDGLVVAGGPEPQRTRRRDLLPAPPVPPDADGVRALVAALRTGQQHRDRHEAAGQADADGPPVPAADPAVVLGLVREAIARRGGVWIGLADATGLTRRVLLHPSRIEGGRVHGYLDRESAGGSRAGGRTPRSGDGHDREQTLSLHRITGAVLAQ